MNEAWESVPTDATLPKKVTNKKVTGLSNDTAGKYGKKAQVNKPTFGKVNSTFH